ncbi:PREDICTED: uncharacterized protein LOC109184693 [Ipomoea nil]|uniref:uncharacterized protein LOC109184693 n=1 Tax=Ipomoea nil TaxID=35883 RepID=UPI000900C47F|nr:PREDICTED: uncharacterized protein LOC109184693 [Ipomoea nil]
MLLWVDQLILCRPISHRLRTPRNGPGLPGEHPPRSSPPTPPTSGKWFKNSPAYRPIRSPAAGGGSLYSRRLDLFSTAGSSTLGAFHHHPSALRVHDLSLHKLSGGIDDSRFCHKKVEMSSFIPSSSNTNFQLTKQQSSAFFNTEDQILTFQPLLQSSLKNPLGNHEPNEPVFGSKSRGSNTHLSAIDGLGISHEQATASLSGFLGQGSANNSDQARNCSTSSALELHPHDKGLENGVCTGDAGSSWPCPN